MHEGELVYKFHLYKVCLYYLSKNCLMIWFSIIICSSSIIPVYMYVSMYVVLIMKMSKINFFRVC